MPEDKSFQLALDDGDLDAAQTAAQQAGVDLEVQPKSQFLDPISIVLITGGIVWIGKFIVDLLDRLKGGLVIDLRPSAKHLVRRDKEVPAGWAMVIAADGKVSISVHDAQKDASERLIGEIIRGAYKSASDVAAAATKLSIKTKAA